jgi:hypothetical protein
MFYYGDMFDLGWSWVSWDVLRGFPSNLYPENDGVECYGARWIKWERLHAIYMTIEIFALNNDFVA